MRAALQCSPIRLTVALLVASAASGCNVLEPRPVEVNGVATTSFSIAPGQEIDIFLQTIGPGEYGAPPALNGSAIAFVEVTMPLQDPGGLSQLFRIRGVEPGTTIITFQQIDNNTPGFPHVNVVDTVTVR
jgi:hypothetical protein